MRLENALPGRLMVALTLDACPGGFDERIAKALVESGNQGDGLRDRPLAAGKSCRPGVPTGAS